MTACHNRASQSNSQDLTCVQTLLNHLTERNASQESLEDFLARAPDCRVRQPPQLEPVAVTSPLRYPSTTPAPLSNGDGARILFSRRDRTYPRKCDGRERG